MRKVSPAVPYDLRFYIVTRKRKRKVLTVFYMVEWKANTIRTVAAAITPCLRSVFSIGVLSVVADFAMRSPSGRVLMVGRIVVSIV